MKLNNTDLTKWLLGGMLTLTIVLVGMVWQQLDGQLDRIDKRQEQLEERVLALQAQYSKIDVVLFRLDRIEEQLRVVTLGN